MSRQPPWVIPASSSVVQRHASWAPHAWAREACEPQNHRVSEHISPAGSPGIGQLIPRGAPAPGGVREMVASASWMVCCSVWLADRVLDREAEFRPPMRAASAVPYGFAAAIGGEL
jgi:hypothetical protein